MRTLILFCICFIVLEAAVFKSVLRHTPSLRQRLLKMGKLSELLKLQFSNLRTESQRLIDYSDTFYLSNITVGTPPQAFTIIPDTGSSDTWVISVNCHTSACKGSEDYKRKFYNQSASKTFKEDGRKFSLFYGSGSCSGYLGVDVISFADFTYSSQIFGIATQIAEIFKLHPMDGIMGLGWPELSTYRVPPPLQNLLSQFDKPLFTVYMARHIDPVSGGDGGVITYGGYDYDNCDMNTLHWVPLSSQTYWQFTLNGLSAGNYTERKWWQVISDTGTSFMYLPQGTYQKTATALGAEFDFRYWMHYFNCTELTSNKLPPIVLDIGAHKYAIPSEQYIIKLDVGKDEMKCFLGVVGESSAGFGPSWILGDVFIRSYCNIHDVGKIRIGFTEVKTP